MYILDDYDVIYFSSIESLNKHEEDYTYKDFKDFKKTLKESDYTASMNKQGVVLVSFKPDIKEIKRIKKLSKDLKEYIDILKLLNLYEDYIVNKMHIKHIKSTKLIEKVVKL